MPVMSQEFVSIVEFGPKEAAVLLTRAFAKHYVAFPHTPTLFTDLARLDSVDLNLSRVMQVDGETVAIALIARRGWTSRLASLVVPAFRRAGHGRSLLEQLLEDARERGDRSMVLEVIEQNTPAVKLYERCGFRRLRRLVGFAGLGSDHLSTAEPEQIDPTEFSRVLLSSAPADLPWQISGETLALLNPAHTAWRLDGAAAVISDVDAPVITIRGLAPGPGGDDSAVALLLALMHQFPGRNWSAKIIFPEEWSGIFERAGLERTSRSQWQMVAGL